MFPYDSSSFADINLTGKVVVVGIFIPSQAQLARPETEVFGQRRVVLAEPEQPQRIIAQPRRKAVAPLPSRRGPGPVFFWKICGKKTRVLIVGVSFIVWQHDH